MSDFTPDHARRLAEKAGFSLPDSALPPLAAYLADLLRWNKVMNLVGTRSAAATFSTLFVDSFHLDAFLRRPSLGLAPAPETWDLGAGAGLPGIPLRALWPAGCYTLVEAREKRALFLKTTLARLALPQTHVFHGRAEVFMDGSRRADCILSRAFMPWQKLLPFVEPHLAPGGILVLLLRDPLPCPAPWRELDSLAYTVGPDTRRLVALGKMEA